MKRLAPCLSTGLSTGLSAGLALALAACTSVPSASIVPEDVQLATTQPGRVLVVTEGSGRPLGLGRRVVSAENLQQAVSDTLALSKAFEAVAAEPPADWRLDVSVSNVERDDWSLEMFGYATLVWRLTSLDDGQLVAQREIETKGRARTEDSKSVEERGRIAMEKALRLNVAEGVEWLAGLELEVPGTR